MMPSKRPPNERNEGVSDLILEKFRLGELNEADTKKVNALKSTKPDQSDVNVVQRLEALAKSDERILEEYPPDLMASQIQKRLLHRSHSFPLRQIIDSIFFRTPKPALALAILLVLLPVGFFVMKEDVAERIKGPKSFITVYRKAGDSFERLSSNSEIKEREVLQVSYVVHEAKYGAIFSIDGNGKLTLHYPEAPGPASKLINTGEVILPNAFELDSSPHFERFIFVTSMDSFDTKEVMSLFQWSKLGENNFEIKLPKHLSHHSVFLRKVGGSK